MPSLIQMNNAALERRCGRFDAVAYVQFVQNVFEVNK
jgi:hypothetical protein